MTVGAGPAAQLWLPTGEPVTLAAPLAAATGEGTVYGVQDRPDWAAKVFHLGLNGLAEKLDKVAAMIESPPPGATQPDGFTVLTWPEQLLTDGDGAVGFVMPLIDTATAVELHTMSNPSDRMKPVVAQRQWTRYVTWAHLVNTAANLCLAVDAVHHVDAVIGDFQERNILVTDTTRVTLVDCDSMQFTDAAGRQFLCPVGRPEFTAPELARLNLRTHPRQQPSDLFALAVHIHQLLMAGNHPFLRGQWTGDGAQPDALTLARSSDWAGGPRSRLRTHPLAPPVAFLPTDIQELFTRAFTAGAHDPSARPTAAQWRSALTRIQLTTCERGTHQIPSSSNCCPWCAIDDERAHRRQQPTTGPTVVVPPPEPVAHPVRRPAPARKSQQDTIFGMTTRTYLTTLAVIVVVVVALAALIIWALLGGTPTTVGGMSGLGGHITLPSTFRS